jgi:hypothetical protein
MKSPGFEKYKKGIDNSRTGPAGWITGEQLDICSNRVTSKTKTTSCIWFTVPWWMAVKKYIITTVMNCPPNGKEKAEVQVSLYTVSLLY